MTGTASYLDAIARLRFEPQNFFIRNGVVSFTGKYAAEEDSGLAEKIATDLIPWRKGPFRLNDLLIDGEWRSDKKWDRLVPSLPSLEGKIVADVGCNNGYYLYRIAAAGAGRVVGFDPTQKYWLQFKFIERHAPRLPVEFLPLGWQALTNFPVAFDVIFLMGVNYHDPQPAEIFHACKKALQPGGLLVCESVIVPGAADLEIFPAGRYAGIGGVYAIPTAAALVRELRCAGFSAVEVQHTVRMTADEQRPSTFSPQSSFNDRADGDVPLCRAAVFAYR